VLWLKAEWFQTDGISTEVSETVVVIISDGILPWKRHVKF
jgi:hypothetical protein